MANIGGYNLNHKADTIKLNPVMRGDDLTNPATNDGIYNQLLFDLCGNNDLVSLSLMGAYNRALDAIGFVNSSVQHIHHDMITYVAASGAAAATPSSGVQTDPCAPGNGVESGGCSFQLTGWGRLRRSSDVRDITDIPIKYCENQPIYRIDGTPIDNDKEWDIVRQMSVLVHDFQRLFITGNNGNAGEADGLEQLVTYGYTDPVSSEACTAMDSTVIDWNGNAICPTNGATAVTYNGNAVTDGYNMFDFVKSFLRRTQQRIQMSSLNGSPLHIGLATTETINCMISCYVCDLVCGGEVERMDTFEARDMVAQLRQEFGANNAVALSFEGYPVLFYAYDWELHDNVTGNSDIYILTPTVGNTPLIRTQVKDMNQVANVSQGEYQFRVTDNNRVLSWETSDHTCYQVHSEMQWRVYMPAPWAQMRITNVSCDTPLGGLSADPLNALFPETNLVAHAEA